MTDPEPTPEPVPELIRRIELEGAFNVRDLGGLPAGSGRVVRSGLLFRSDSPQLLTDTAVRHLVGDLGVHTVLDLRYEDESEREGIGLLAAEAVEHLNVPIRATDGSYAPTNPFADPGAEDVPPIWETTFAYYQGYFLAYDGAGLVAAVKALAADGALPAIVHCAAGKDRTGGVIAVVLAAVGVDIADIAEDYAETSKAVPNIIRRLAGLPSYTALDPDDLKYHLTYPETMTALMQWVESDLGGVRPWLMARGVTEQELDILCERLTGPERADPPERTGTND